MFVALLPFLIFLISVNKSEHEMTEKKEEPMSDQVIVLSLTDVLGYLFLSKKVLPLGRVTGLM